jgi:DUF1680 family protein
MYSIGEDGLYINMYGGNVLKTELHDSAMLVLEQVTDYPWDGKIVIVVKDLSTASEKIHFRIPGWCKGYSVVFNGKGKEVYKVVDGYISKEMKKGDRIELIFDMPATLLESNPLVEETKNQVTVKRGPIVYCLESADLPNQNIFDADEN